MSEFFVDVLGATLMPMIASAAMAVAIVTAIRQIANAIPDKHSPRAQKCARFLLNKNER